MSIFSDKSKGFPYAALKLLKYKALIIAATLMLTTFGTVMAYADKPIGAEKVLGQQVSTLGDALDKAYKYSFDTAGIGIVMSYGSKNGVSAESIGDQFVKEFQRRGFDAHYYYYTTDRAGMAMTFRIGHSSMGPWDVDTAGSKMSNIVERAKAARKIHSK